MQILTIALSALLLPTGALAWGAYGHETVAYVAASFVSAPTRTFFQSLLGDASADYLAGVATFADSYRSTAAGGFSAPFHYVDARDSPPGSCGVSYSRDCGPGGCVISAISNYTNRVLDTSLSSADRQLAAKMIIHLVGDVGQPLHCEALDAGGNAIGVTYGGASTNLHAVWDTQIPEAVGGGSSLAQAKAWASALTTAINSGEYKAQAAGWVSGLDIADAIGSATAWASESNAAVCSTVLSRGVSYVETNDLSGAYADAAGPVVKLQIAKQGYRLARWLDAIAAAV